MTPAREEMDPAERGRRAFREVTLTLALAVGLLGVTLLAIAIAEREAAVAVGSVAFAVAALAGVIVIRRIRVAIAARSAVIERERSGREQMERTLAATRALVSARTSEELLRRICEVACDVFGCSAVSLWDVDGEHMKLLDRVPFTPPYRAGERRPIAELPGLRDAFASTEPLYVADLRTAATGVTQATAEITATGSLLNVPVVIGGKTRLSLVLTWSEILPGVSDAQRLAAQRYAEQAALALEQLRTRLAQAEADSLNDTLRRMVQTDPLFRADGTVDEVAEAICAEALRIFEAEAAALWIEAGESIELLHRIPTAAIFGARQRISFAEHPGFHENLGAGRPVFIADVEFEDPVLWERFARYSESRAQLRLPLASSGGARALIVLSWTTTVDPPSEEVSALASRFADQAGIAVAEAARRDAQREVGALHARFEESLLPRLDLDGVATCYRPGDERLSLGGDFYDCVQRADGSISVLIGDVAGHGAASAALGAGLRSAWRALELRGPEVEDLARELQQVCTSERHDPYAFVTVLLGVVDPARATLRFVSAGHPPPVIVGGAPIECVNGPPLGVVADAHWQLVEVALPHPCTVLLHTDGLVEGRAEPGSIDRLGIEAIRDRIAAATPGAVTAADLDDLVAYAARANGAGLPDDVALLAINLGT